VPLSAHATWHPGGPGASIAATEVNLPVKFKNFDSEQLETRKLLTGRLHQPATKIRAT
jgi:hypothetical protein